MEKVRVLLYYPPNKRSIGFNAIITLLSKLDVDLFVLTQQGYGKLHEDLKGKLPKEHILASEIPFKEGLPFYYIHTKKLIQICRQYQINIVFSHLQSGNLIALVASAFLKNVKFIFFRHHFHYYKKFRVDYLKIGLKEKLGEKIVNFFAKKIIVPSTTVKEGMIQYEGVKESKVHLIPYIYNFEEYPEVNQENLLRIRNKYHAHLLLLMSSRFVKEKRHDLVVEILGRLIKKGFDIKMIMVDDGPLRPKVVDKVKTFGLENNIFYVGYTERILDYMAASDMLIHPSLSEASNSSVKETGLVGRTAIVCSGVGDFDDYIIDKENGFLIDPLNSESELESAIIYAYEHKESLPKMGEALRKKVMDTFSANERIILLYKNLLQ